MILFSASVKHKRQMIGELVNKLRIVLPDLYCYMDEEDVSRTKNPSTSATDLSGPSSDGFERDGRILDDKLSFERDDAP